MKRQTIAALLTLASFFSIANTGNAAVGMSSAASSTATPSVASAASTPTEITHVNNPQTLKTYLGNKIESALRSPEQREAARQQNLDKPSLPSPVPFNDSALSAEQSENYFKLNRLNEGLPSLTHTANLQTPMATLEFFQTQVLQQRFDRASYALNLNAYPASEQAQRGAVLAKKLDYLMVEKGLYNFDEIPDRPDGMAEPVVGNTNPIEGTARRSIRLGTMDYKERRIPLYLERVQVGNQSPQWMFSQATVENIDLLYEQHKPAKFEKRLPTWIKTRIFGIAIWEILALIFLFIVIFAVGWLINQGIARVVKWYENRHQKSDDTTAQLSKEGKMLADLVSKLVLPFAAVISFFVLYLLVSGGLPFVDPIASSTRPIIWVTLVFLLIWLGIRVINFFANRYQDLQIDLLSDEQFDKQRRRRTYLSVFRRVFIFSMVLVGAWVSLSAFTNIEALGTTLLTSAGIAGAIIGIAAQPTLGNIIAGMQVAVTQPLRIGDTVMIEGEWSTVEDLRYTYAVIKTWDERRLIVPMKYLVTEVIENLSHTDTQQARAVYLYVDYGVNIAAIREQFIHTVKSHQLWLVDTEIELLVNDMNEHGITLRGKLVANSPNDAWQLECEVRESMLDYLAKHYPNHLPLHRLAITNHTNPVTTSPISSTSERNDQ